MKSRRRTDVQTLDLFAAHGREEEGLDTATALAPDAISSTEMLTALERLADLGESAGCWDAMAAIIANGTADPYEPPTYAQQLVRANHRADVAERERDQLLAEVERLRNELAGKPLVC